jgi:hypothetical protein
LIKPSDDVGFLVIRKNQTEHVKLVVVSALPERYIPKSGARHSSILQPDWTEIPQSFLVGHRWTAELFGELERWYLNAFALSYFLDPGAETPLPHAVTSWVLDGYSYGKLYAVLRQHLPENENAHATSVAAASPGVLTIAASKRTAHRVALALQALKSPETAKAYNTLHAWSKLDEKNEIDSVPLTAGDDLRRLSGMLFVDMARILPERHDAAQVLRAGKIVASYYRQLEKLAYPPQGVEFLAPQVAQPRPVVVGVTAGEGELDEAEEDDDFDDVYHDDFDNED